MRDEVICDSLGGINIFHDIPGMEETAQELLDASFIAAQEQQEGANGTRGPPSTADAKTSMELDDLVDNIRKAPGIKWNGGMAIKLSRSEYAAVTSRISTRYYYANTRHDGVQVIDRTTDGNNAQHYVYLYTDHGFGSYQIIGRLTYGRNDAIISYIKEVVSNDGTVDSTAEGVSESVGELRHFYEHADSGGVAHYNRATYDGNEQTDTGSRGVRAGSDRRTGRADTGGYDDGGNAGEVKTRFSQDLAELDDLRKENERLRKQADYWKGQLRRTTPETRTLRQADVDKLAKNLVKQYGSTLSAADLHHILIPPAGEISVRDGCPQVAALSQKVKAVLGCNAALFQSQMLPDMLHQKSGGLLHREQPLKIRSVQQVQFFPLGAEPSVIRGLPRANDRAHGFSLCPVS